jgi:hypothetical protein
MGSGHASSAKPARSLESNYKPRLSTASDMILVDTIRVSLR